MKRFFAWFLSVLITISFLLVSVSSADAGNIITIEQYTIEFTAESVFSTEEQEVIAQYIVSNDNMNQNNTTYNLLCTLFGHNTSVESVVVVEHCVSSTQPRCLRSIQELTVCSRCETLLAMNTISQVYIYCCE